MSLAEHKIVERLGLLFPAFQASGVARLSEKGAVVFGRFDGLAAVAKLVHPSNVDWNRWFAQELRCYRAAERDYPPMSMPRLIAVSDDESAFITSYIQGNVVNSGRFYPSGINPTVLLQLVDHLDRLSNWAPQHSHFSVETLQDLAERAAQYVSRGYLMPGDYRLLTRVAARADPTPRFAHGDPVASNVLWDNDTLSLIDWEHSGFRTVGFDTAVLWIMCADAPEARVSIVKQLEQREQKFTHSFLCSLIRLLGREIGNFSRAVLPESESRINQFRTTLEQIGNMACRPGARGKLDVGLIA